LSCSHAPQGSGYYCCFWGFGGSPMTCVPDDSLAVCLNGNAYGYKCTASFSPATLDPQLQLNCPSAPVLDPDGLHFDYCCFPP